MRLMLILLAWLSACASAFVLKGPKLGLARLFRWPYRGPCIVLDIIGAELIPESNRRLDWSSPFKVISAGRPDLRVVWIHGSSRGETQVEDCTYEPSWYWSRKIPYRSDAGISFKVVDVDVLSDNEVVGRCFCSAKEIRNAMKTKKPMVMSLGDKIGKLKVMVNGPLKSQENADMLKQNKSSTNEQKLATSRSQCCTPKQEPP